MEPIDERLDDRPALRRVVMVTPRFFPLMGGVETHVYEVGQRLVRAGLSVTVLTTDPTGQLRAQDEIAGLSVKRLPAYPRGRDYYFAPALPQAIVQAVAADGDGCSLVHFQGCHTLVAPLGMAAALRHSIPYVVTFHTGGHSSRLRSAIRDLQWTTLRPLLRRADTLIAVSAFERDLFAKRLGLSADREPRIALIPNGGALPDLTPDAAPPAAPAHLHHDTVAATTAVAPGVSCVSDASAQDPLILSIGRLERYKGHHRAVAAFATVHQAFPTARLLIVGAGPEEARLRRQVAHAGLARHAEILSIPSGDRAQMARLISRATLVTLLSEYEAHPIAIMEALALGRPVLVARNSGLDELALKGWVTAVSLRSSDTTIGHAMVDQLERPLYPLGVELPTWETCAQQLQQVYVDVLRRRYGAHSDARSVL